MTDEQTEDELRIIATARNGYRVAWEVKATGATGHGKVMDRHLADAWVEHGNKECPGISHWVEAT